ncbi:MAG: alpha/beta fold hydrolase [Ferrovum sp.]|nr:alpha/beta fold hydrolase [Ferrovum sp.]
MNRLSPSFQLSHALVPPLWLRHPQGQTLYAALWASTPKVDWIREVWSCPDGDEVQVDRLAGQPSQPVLILFHGLEGSSQSPYVRSLAHAAQSAGWHVIAPNFRACGNVLNLLPRLYHAGDSAEIHWLLHRVRQEFPHSPRYATGFSLGANMLLKWLGEQEKYAASWLHGAVAVATPFDLRIVGDHLAKGFNRLYTHHFLSTLKSKAQAKHQQFPGLFNLKHTLGAHTLRDFDDHCMAPLHGFKDAEDYWKRSSSLPWLKHIEIPTLLLQSRDDPFVPVHALPGIQDLSLAIRMDLQHFGGHVGFVAGRWRCHTRWMPERVLKFLQHPEIPTPSQQHPDIRE